MLKSFFKGVKSEVKKVIWPSRKQLINNTVLVVVLVLGLSVVILGFDVILEFIDSKFWNFISTKI